MPFALGELGVIMIPHATYRACFFTHPFGSGPHS